MAVALAIPENFTYKKRYSSHLREMSEKKCASIGRALFGLLFGECGYKHTFSGTCTEIAARLHCARSSVSRSFSALKKAGMVERLEGKRSEYKTDQKIKDKDFYVLTPDFLRTMKFEFGNGVTRYLRPNEIDVVSFVLSKSMKEQREEGYEGSVCGMAGSLGMSVTTASDTIESLLPSGLIEKKETNKTKNGYPIFRYVAHEGLVRAMRKAFNKHKDVDLRPKAVRETEKRQEYIATEQRRQEKAERAAAEYCRKAHKQIPDLEDIDFRLARLEFEIANAEVKGLAELPDFERERQTLKEKRASILRKYHIDEEKFTAEYYLKTRKRP